MTPCNAQRHLLSRRVDAGVIPPLDGEGGLRSKPGGVTAP
jgi:hypothetical protein